MLNIRIEPAQALKAKPADNELGFGRFFIYDPVALGMVICFFALCYFHIVALGATSCQQAFFFAGCLSFQDPLVKCMLAQAAVRLIIAASGKEQQRTYYQNERK